MWRRLVRLQWAFLGMAAILAGEWVHARPSRRPASPPATDVLPAGRGAQHLALGMASARPGRSTGRDTGSSWVGGRILDPGTVHRRRLCGLEAGAAQAASGHHRYIVPKAPVLALPSAGHDRGC